MEARELRYGNWVRRKASDSNIQLDYGDITPSIMALYAPIRVTEEILLKCGFERRIQGVCDYFHIGENPVTHDWLFDLVWLKDIITGEYELSGPFYRNGHHKIKHIHQLQNLYFALTGQELEITL